MDRIVYLGPYNNKKKREFFHKSVEYLKENKGDKFYYILPNGNLLIQYRKAMVNEVEKTLDINLFTFDDIADRLIEDNFYSLIDGDMKEAFLVQILAKLREENKLKYYKNISTKKGFIKILSNIIGEIKQSLITSDVYLSKCPKEPFFMEIGFIYKEYERGLAEAGFIDREGSFFKSLEKLKKDNSFFNDLDFILIDEFFDFRVQEMELLKEISKTQVPIYINMPFQRKENFSTLNNTLETLKDLGFEVKYVEKENLSFYEEIGSKIFTNSSIEQDSNLNIKKIVANNNYLELKKVAEEIKYHYSQGTKLEDMAIVLSNSNDYKKTLFQVFREEEIPLSIDQETSLIEIPIIKELLYILELKAKMDKQSTINRIKSNYFSICNKEEREAIEYILRKTPFNTLEDLKNSEQLLASTYGETIEKTIEIIQQELELIPEIALVEEYVKLIETIIDNFSVEEKILNIYDELEDYQLLYRDFLTIEKFDNLIGELKKLSKVFSKEISLESFLELMENYLQNETIVEFEGNNKGVNVLTPVTTRGQIYKVVFVTGLSQAKYPNLLDENFFFREKNYKELREIGIDYKNYHEKLDKESLLFSTVISSCSNYLYLSYSENATGEEKDIPSMFLDEIIEKTEECKIQTINVDIDYLIKDNPKELTTNKELIKYYLKNYYEEEFTEEIIPIPDYIDMDLFEKLNNRLLCEVERGNESFNQYSGNIRDNNIMKDIENIHKDKIYSISYLESYGKCPYLFLLNNILQVEEMERELMDFTPLDRGIVIHEVLKNYYIKYKKKIENHVLGREIFDIDSTYEYIMESITNSMKALNLDIESNLWKMRIENNANNILNFIKADLDRMTKYKNKILPLDYELSFGWKKPFYIEVDGMKIPMVGKIDRIDKYVDEDKYIIIDYKNTDYNLRNMGHMANGLSLQLPIYMMSLEDQDVVAAAYGIISKGEMDFKIINREEKELVGRKRTGIVNEEELEELLNLTRDFIIEYVNSIHSGDFSINPKECSPYCIYKDICRYEENLEVLI